LCLPKELGVGEPILHARNKQCPCDTLINTFKMYQNT